MPTAIPRRTLFHALTAARGTSTRIRPRSWPAPLRLSRPWNLQLSESTSPAPPPPGRQNAKPVGGNTLESRHSHNPPPSGLNPTNPLLRFQSYPWVEGSQNPFRAALSLPVLGRTFNFRGLMSIRHDMESQAQAVITTPVVTSPLFPVSNSSSANAVPSMSVRSLHEVSKINEVAMGSGIRRRSPDRDVAPPGPAGTRQWIRTQTRLGFVFLPLGFQEDHCYYMIPVLSDMECVRNMDAIFTLVL